MKNSTNVRRYEPLPKPTTRELAALQILNADLDGQFPEVQAERPSIRPQAVRGAMRNCGNKYELCRMTAKLARAIHDSRSERLADAINAALGMMARPHRRKAPERAIAA